MARRDGPEDGEQGGDGAAGCCVPSVTAAAVQDCAFSHWAPRFVGHTHRAECIDLPQARRHLRQQLRAVGCVLLADSNATSVDCPQAFVDFLLEDGVHLHSSSAAMPQRPAVDPLDAADSAFTADDDDDDAGSDDVPAARFPELHTSIEAAIARLGGAVFPKLNWSAPKDAVWVTFAGSLRCTNADEVLLLLKSSDAIAHDLEYAYAQCEDCTPEQAPQTPPQLVLKKWFDLKPAGEFRCFVRDGRLLAASQRHCADHFPFLAADMPGLRHQLRAFHRHRVAAAFPQPHYTYDVYVTAAGSIRVLDFNPYGGSTLPLLFSWSELDALAADPDGDSDADDGAAPSGDDEEPPRRLLPVVRVVETPQMVRPGLRTGVPVDLYDSSAGSALSQLLARCREEETHA